LPQTKFIKTFVEIFQQVLPPPICNVNSQS
jgi:hypothetical protein